MKRILLIALLLMVGQSLFAQPLEHLWHRTYGGAGIDQPHAICATPDGGFLVGGLSRLYPVYHDALLMKLNADGDTIWTRIYGGAAGDEIRSIIPVAAGGYLLCGFTWSIGNGLWDKWAVRIDEDGVQQWQAAFGNADHDYAFAACELTNGDFVIAGEGQHGLVRMTSGGAFVWSYTPAVSDVKATPDGGFAALRFSNTFEYFGNLELLKFDQFNVLEWSQEYPPTNPNPWWWSNYAEYSERALCVLPDGYYFATELGFDGPMGGAPNVFDMRRVDGNGDVVWRRFYQPSFANDYCRTLSMSDGNLALFGQTIGAITHTVLAVFSPEGNLLAQRLDEYLNYAYWSDPFDITEAPGGGIAVCGETGNPNLQYRVVRYGGIGNIDNAGELRIVIGEETWWMDRGWLALHWSAGAVSRVVITDICPGTTGFVEGEAAATWYVLPNGDGNDGDSIIFESPVPLTSGSVSVFGLNIAPDCRSEFHWSAGDLAGTLDYPLPVELLSFEAIAGDSRVTLEWTTASETDNERFEIRRNGDLMASVPTQGNGSSQQSYSWTDNAVTNDVTYEYELSSVDINGDVQVLGERSATPRADAVPLDYELIGNYPNPFNPTTNISFTLAEAQFVTIRVFNTLGREVATLGNATLAAGAHEMTFDAHGLSSGVYLYELEAGPFRDFGKMVLMK